VGPQSGGIELRARPGGPSAAVAAHRLATEVAGLVGVDPPAEPPVLERDLEALAGFVDLLAGREALLGEQLHSASQRLERITDELIPLRDWVRMMSCTEHEVTGELFCKQFSNLYRKLGQILEKRGMELLEEQAAFDSRTQKVVGTVPAERPEQVDQVQDTVVPGYRLDGALVRPQHVMVFTRVS